MANYIKDKTIIISALVTVGVIATAIFVSILRKKKIIKQIEAKIASGEGAEGTLADLAASKAFSTTYWKEVVNANLLTAAKALKYAKLLFIRIKPKEAYQSGKFSEAEFIEAGKTNGLEIFKNLKNWAQVSQVSFFYSKYARNLYTDIEETKYGIYDFFEKFDIFGLWSVPDKSTTQAEKISQYIKLLPKK